MKILFTFLTLIFVNQCLLQGQCSPDYEPCSDKPNAISHCVDSYIDCNGERHCSNGECYYSCTAGPDAVWTDCNNDRDSLDSDGCEINIANDPMNCGQCGYECPVEPIDELFGDLHARLVGCIGGQCIYECEEGWMDCDEDLNIPRQARTKRWSGCECPVQPNTIELSCRSYREGYPRKIICDLECKNGYFDCNGDLQFRIPGDGCEINLTNDINNCGACRDTCFSRPNATVECIDSVCVYSCKLGFKDCDGDLNVSRDSLSNGCECVEEDENKELAGCSNEECIYCLKRPYTDLQVKGIDADGNPDCTYNCIDGFKDTNKDLAYAESDGCECLDRSDKNAVDERSILGSCYYRCKQTLTKWSLDCDLDLLNLPLTILSPTNGCECTFNTITKIPENCENCTTSGVELNVEKVIADQFFDASKKIVSSANIPQGMTAIFRAGEEIILKPGFYASSALMTIISPNLNNSSTKVQKAKKSTPLTLDEIKVDKTNNLSFELNTSQVSDEFLASISQLKTKGHYNYLPKDKHYDSSPKSMERQLINKPKDYSAVTIQKSNSPLAKLLVSPNPFHEEFHLEYLLRYSTKVKISLYDLMGHRIGLIYENNQKAGNYIVNVSLPDVPPGMYILTLETTDHINRKKIIKI